MSRAKILKLQNQLETILSPFEKAIEKISPSQSLEELETMLRTAEELRVVLENIKSHFKEVRNLLSDTSGIPPAKELAQLLIGASSEAISSLREVKHHLEDFLEKLRGKRGKTLSSDELHYAEFGSLTAIRRSHYIINRITEHLDEVPDPK